jgi:hypothetical protein
MRTTHEILSKTKELGSCFFSLCDSHGLQLLIKDVLLMECFGEIFLKIKAAAITVARLPESAI